MRVLAAFCVVVLLAGCAAPAVPGPAPEAVPAQAPSPAATPNAAAPAPAPAPVPPPAAPVALPNGGATAPTRDTKALQVWGNFEERHAATSGDATIAVDTGPLTIRGEIVAKTEAEATQALRITGGRLLWPPVLRKSPQDSWTIEAYLAEGPVGETISVSLAPGPGKELLTMTLQRAAGPTVAISVAAEDGTWVPLRSGVSLPPGPKRLRFRTGGGLPANALYLGYMGTNYDKLVPDRVTVLADDLLEVEFTNPPPLVQMTLGGNNGRLRLPFASAHFYIGEPPALVALDPATGSTQAIGTAPPDIYYAVVRKDGRYVALTTLIPESTLGIAVWLMDLKTGALTRTPFECEDGAGPGFDARGRLIGSMEGGRIGVLTPETGRVEIQPSATSFWSGLSPDGRYAAGRVGPRPGRSIGGWVGPPRAFQLVVRDLLTDTEQVFPWGGYGMAQWLPDGQLVLSTIATDEGPDTGHDPNRETHLFTVDPTTGKQTPYTGLWPVGYPPTPAGYQPKGPDERVLATLPDGCVLLLHWPNLPNMRHAMI